MTKKEAVLTVPAAEPPVQDQSLPGFRPLAGIKETTCPTSLKSERDGMNHGLSIPDSTLPVKPNIITSLRLAKGLPVRDMVAVVQVLYPKYEKTLHSKCEHGAEYGVQLRPDALHALLDAFAPERARRQAYDQERNSRRIQARLEADVLCRFRMVLAEDGYTVQGWIEKQVLEYIEGRCEDG